MNKCTMQLLQELPQDVEDDFIELLAQDAQCFKNINIHPKLSYSIGSETLMKLGFQKK